MTQKIEPIWHNLPLHFRQEVVERLPYKDRCSLQKCSKTDRHCVLQSKLFLSDIAILVCADYTMFSYSDQKDTVNIVKYFKNSEKNQLKIEFTTSPRVYKPLKNQKIMSKNSRILESIRDQDDIDFGIQDFIRAIRKLSVDNFLINDAIIADYHPAPDTDKLNIFRVQFLKSFGSVNRKIQAELLKIKFESTGCQISEILAHFQPEILQKLALIDRKATWQIREEVTGTLQWKHLKKVYLEVKTDLELEDVLHVDEIQAHVADMAPEDVWRVIWVFLHKPRPGASFHFSYQDSNPDLQRILETFNVPPQNLPIQAQNQLRTVLSRRFLFTQRFHMPACRDLVLVVMIAEKEVLGTVCHVDLVNVEAKVEMGLMRNSHDNALRSIQQPRIEGV